MALVFSSHVIQQKRKTSAKIMSVVGVGKFLGRIIKSSDLGHRCTFWSVSSSVLGGARFELWFSNCGLWSISVTVPVNSLEMHILGSPTEPEALGWGPAVCVLPAVLVIPMPAEVENH